MTFLLFGVSSLMPALKAALRKLFPDFQKLQKSQAWHSQSGYRQHWNTSGAKWLKNLKNTWTTLCCWFTVTAFSTKWRKSVHLYCHYFAYLFINWDQTHYRSQLLSWVSIYQWHFLYLPHWAFGKLHSFSSPSRFLQNYLWGALPQCF